MARKVQVRCRRCAGSGADSATSSEPGHVSFSVCPDCNGSRVMEVDPDDHAWSISINNSNKDGKRLVMGLTWAGDVDVSGGPLSRDERQALATSNDKTGGLMSMVGVIASEVARLREELLESRVLILDLKREMHQLILGSTMDDPRPDRG